MDLVWVGVETRGKQTGGNEAPDACTPQPPRLDALAPLVTKSCRQTAMLRRFRALSRRQKALVAITAGAAGAVAAYYAGRQYLESYVDSLRDADRLEAVQARHWVR